MCRGVGADTRNVWISDEIQIRVPSLRQIGRAVLHGPDELLAHRHLVVRVSNQVTSDHVIAQVSYASLIQSTQPRKAT
jgi:hypothetical protein